MDKTVMIYLEKDNKYLMLYRNKKKKDINKNKYIGVGGHVEKGETPDEAIVREVKEETGLDLLSFIKRGLVYFVLNGYEEEMCISAGVGVLAGGIDAAGEHDWLRSICGTGKFSCGGESDRFCGCGCAGHGCCGAGG